MSKPDKEVMRKAIKRAKAADADEMDDFWLWICNGGKFTDEHDRIIAERQKPTPAPEGRP